MVEPRILVTNDDGIHSIGLKILYDAVEPLGKVYVVAPETPKSASGLGITLHKPLRLEKVRNWGIDIYITNGTPSDIVYLALHEITPSLDLVVAGVNIGDNTSVQVILSSGTVGAVAQATLMGIKGIAFSADVDTAEELERERYSIYLRELSRVISKHVLDNGIPEGVDLINVNYPRVINENTRVVVARPSRIKFLQKINVNYDPYGRKYYWLYGKIIDPEPGTDLYYLKKERAITLTPISLNLQPDTRPRELEELASIVEDAIKNVSPG